MRGETLIQQHPPTPPSTGGEYRTGLQHIAHYNTAPGFAYASPRTIAHEAIPSHGSHVDVYAAPVGEYYHDGQYAGLPNEQPLFSPPTPRSTFDDDVERRKTRNGNAVAASSSPRRGEASPRPRPKLTPKSRKPKAAKGERTTTPKLTAPLSILTAELHHIPVKNMEEWVNRPADVRLDEAEKRNGYITRPMNSFMLYRSAYAERAKAWCAQNNHQIVSSVAGESWPLEPAGIRDLYNEYAKIERINHHNAHPSYKFTPSKSTAPAKKRKGEWSDDEEPSDLDDTEWAPGSGRTRNRQAKRVERSLSYASNGINPEFFDQRFGPNGLAVNKSSWEMTNEGSRPTPMAMHNDVYNQYYQTSAYPGIMTTNYQDDLRRVAVPAAQFTSDHALLGLPGGNDLMQQMHSQIGAPFEERQLDPMLLAYDGSQHAGIEPIALQHGYRIGHGHVLDTKLEQHDIDRLLEISPTRNDSHTGPWQSDPTMVSLEQESEFDKWIGEQQ
ncbi:hypothetical protein ACEQ8H_003766 [Pleosporales sp. CAS-2024a]